MLIKQTIIILVFGIGMILPKAPTTENNTNTGSNYSKTEAIEMVKRHNDYRSEVGVEDVEWSNEIAKAAQKWANNLANTRCNLKHSKSRKYGENLFMGSRDSYSPTYITDSWGSEKSKWRGGKVTMENYARAGHYTQMIWHSTTEIGCGKAICADGSIIVCCNYNPKGNMIGQKPTGK